VIRLLTSDGIHDPQPLVDIDDGDWEVLLDVLDGELRNDLRADGSPHSWLVDDETIAFLEWNAFSPVAASALRTRMRKDGFVELMWEEVSHGLPWVS
jgi:hypothetical protein